MTDKLLDDLRHALGSAYTIERELMGGGMSRVFVAKEHALGREVVIKVLPPELAAGVNRERFRREVQLAARLSHPYIVPLLSAGESGELLWFTMPYIPGESLRTRLQRNGPLAVPEVVRLLRDVVEALAYAHSRGVIHRDIKPGNILSDGHHALVTDFGVAKALNAAMPGGPGHTTSGMVIGTPAYMAPEQLAGDPAADQRVDIYAIGLLAYELLSGASPFNEKSPTATMTAQLTRIPAPLHEMQPEVPPAFSELIQHCLAKAPDERPQNAAAVLAELDRISGALAAAAHRDAHGESATMRRAASLPLVLALAGVVGLVIAGVWFTQRSNAGARTVKPDTAVLIVRAGRDSGDPKELRLPAKPMTHADSLRIAEAMRDELDLGDSLAQKAASTSASQPVSPTPPRSLGAEFARDDSVLRARYRALATSAPVAPPGAAVTPAVPAPAGRSGTPTASVASDTNGPRRVIVFATHGRSTTTDSAQIVLEKGVVSELANRLRRFGQWHVLTRDSLPASATPGQAFLDGADVMVIMAFHHNGTDSVGLQIEARNLQNQSSFGFRVLTSAMAYKPASIDPFRNTIRDAARVLEDLRRLPRGQPWPLDQGRGRDGGRGASPNLRGGGPYVPAPGDSVRRFGRRGAGRDSLF